MNIYLLWISNAVIHMVADVFGAQIFQSINDIYFLTYSKILDKMDESMKVSAAFKNIHYFYIQTFLDSFARNRTYAYKRTI